MNTKKVKNMSILVTSGTDRTSDQVPNVRILNTAFQGFLGIMTSLKLQNDIYFDIQSLWFGGFCGGPLDRTVDRHRVIISHTIAWDCPFK
jgi:hypothetical protein